MLRPADLLPLARLSLTDPERAADALLRLPLPVQARWHLLILAVLAGVVLAYLPPVLTAPPGFAPSPFLAAGVQLSLHVATIFLITVVGQRLGGRGRFEDALFLVGWLQLLMAGFQALQLLILFVMPPLAVLVAMASVAAFLWILTGFVRQLHGFASRGAVLLGIIAGGFALGFALAMGMIMLGIDPTGLMDV